MFLRRLLNRSAMSALCSPKRILGDAANSLTCFSPSKRLQRDLASFAELRVKKLSDQAYLPTRGSKQAAGYDLYAAYEGIVPARGKALIKTDIATAIPSGYYGRVAPRSGLAWKNSIDVGAGVIDEDYRGNVGVILFNHSDVDFSVSRGDRIAQLILEKIITPEVVEVDNLDDTERGENGFGSSGVKTVS